MVGAGTPLSRLRSAIRIDPPIVAASPCAGTHGEYSLPIADSNTTSSDRYRYRRLFMFRRLASSGLPAPRRLALAALLLLIVFAVIGGPAVGKLTASRAFDDPGSQSTHAREQIEQATGHGAYPEIVALVKAPPSGAE